MLIIGSFGQKWGFPQLLVLIWLSCGLFWKDAKIGVLRRGQWLDCFVFFIFPSMEQLPPVEFHCSAKRVLDFSAFQRYSWGRVACQSLVHSVKCADYTTKESYTIEGFIFILQIWAYESVTGLGELYVNKIVGENVPLLSWSGSRRFKFEDFIREEKKHHEGKVLFSSFVFSMLVILINDLNN